MIFGALSLYHYAKKIYSIFNVAGSSIFIMVYKKPSTRQLTQKPKYGAAKQTMSYSGCYHQR
jgi:hypothetical protein